MKKEFVMKTYANFLLIVASFLIVDQALADDLFVIIPQQKYTVSQKDYHDSIRINTDASVIFLCKINPKSLEKETATVNVGADQKLEIKKLPYKNGDEYARYQSPGMDPQKYDKRAQGTLSIKDGQAYGQLIIDKQSWIFLPLGEGITAVVRID
jgi:hypothetical protein